MVLATFDLTNPKLLTDAASQQWWVALAQRAHQTAARRPISNLNSNGGNEFSNLPELRAPLMPVLSTAVMLYVLIAGPLNFWLLRRRDRVMWLTLTVPLLGVLCTGLNVAYAYRLHGNSILLRELCFSVLSEGSTHLLTERVDSVYVPRATSFEVRFPPRGIFHSEMNSNGTDLSGVWVSREDGEILHDFQLPPWSGRALYSRQMDDVPGSFEMHGVANHQRWIGRINNRTNLRLSPCVLLWNHGESETFTLERGAQKLQIPWSQTNFSALHTGVDTMLDDAVVNRIRELYTNGPPVLVGLCEQLPVAAVRFDPAMNEVERRNLVVLVPKP
jgi:hypothetical protein